MFLMILEVNDLYSYFATAVALCLAGVVLSFRSDLVSEWVFTLMRSHLLPWLSRRDRRRWEKVQLKKGLTLSQLREEITLSLKLAKLRARLHDQNLKIWQAGKLYYLAQKVRQVAVVFWGVQLVGGIIQIASKELAGTEIQHWYFGQTADKSAWIILGLTGFTAGFASFCSALIYRYWDVCNVEADNAEDGIDAILDVYSDDDNLVTGSRDSAVGTDGKSGPVQITAL